MKFTCERCGKKYATAENPAPGRVYKLKCKACGHLIVVKAAAAASEHAGSTPPEPPSIGLEIGTPEPARIPPPVPAQSHAFDTTTDVSTAQMRVQHDLELTPRRGDSGYVDLFSDVTSETPQKSEDPFLSAARNSLPEGYGSGGSNAPDPFAGLREDISATSAPSEPPPRSHPAVPKVPVIPKPKQVKSVVPLVLIGAGVAVMVGILAFVMLSAGKKETPRASAPPAVATSAPSAPAAAPPAPVAAPPETARTAPVTAPAQAAPPPQVDESEKRARAEQKRREREQAEARAEQTRAEQARAEQARAEQARADREARAARDARDREAKAVARAEKDARDRAAREASQRDKAEREARAKADREAKAQRDREEREARAQRERDARDAKERAAADARERERLSRQASAAESASAEPDGGLTQAQIESVLRSTKSAFDSCIQAARGGDVKLDGRRVMLRLNIQTTGAVTYPTLDDVTLNGTELGTCLKSAARLMVFPKFKGDTMHVEVPLVMR